MGRRRGSYGGERAGGEEEGLVGRGRGWWEGEEAVGEKGERWG